jgi:sugar O-acyltransferase (sialic acid O-acetyltransferase NeuD family)
LVKKQAVVVVGAGGFGRETLDILLASEKVTHQWRILGFVDDRLFETNEEYAGFRVLGPIDWLAEQKTPEKIAVLVAIGDNPTRMRVARKISDMGCGFATVVHPTATITGSVTLGKGVIITAGCVLTNRIRIGNHVIVSFNCTIGHDVTIEDFVNLNPGVSINGSNVVGEGAYVGSGAITIQNIRIGRWSVIGAGAVVTKDIPDYVLAVGVPAKIKKEVARQDEAQANQ